VADVCADDTDEDAADVCADIGGILSVEMSQWMTFTNQAYCGI